MCRVADVTILPTGCWEDGLKPWRAGIWVDTGRMLLNIRIPSFGEREVSIFLKSLTFRPSLRAKGRLEWELLRLCRCFSHSGRATPKAVL